MSIELSPVEKGIKHRPGEFAFVRFPSSISSEPHPFTISSAPSEGKIRFTVKALGDYTRRLSRSLSVGDQANVSGSYGDFTRRENGKNREIWIAAGVGITPFMAFSEALKSDGPEIDLFYCFNSKDQAPHLDEIELLSAQTQRLTLHQFDSSLGNRLTVEAIEKALGNDLASAKAWFCGPKKMREQIRSGLVQAGLRARFFHFEEFEIRSGLGLRKVLVTVLPSLKSVVLPRLRKHV